MTSRPVLRSDDAFLAEPVHEETPRHTAYRFTLALTRPSIAWVFVWAFLDKTFGWGHESLSKAAWANGGSPTQGVRGDCRESLLAPHTATTASPLRARPGSTPIARRGSLPPAMRVG
jgi:hypothetical protein